MHDRFGIGAPPAPVPIETLRLLLVFDTVLPIGYGSGFCLMALGLAASGAKPGVV